MKKAIYAIEPEMEVHFACEEYALFSQTDRPIIAALIMEHAAPREKFRDIDIPVIRMEREEFHKDIGKVEGFRPLITGFRTLKGSHIPKEENILLPCLRENLTPAKPEKIQAKLDEFDNIVASNLI